MTVLAVFQRCVEAIQRGDLIERLSPEEKEFHFQNWFKKRLEETGYNFEQGARNSYPDFNIVQATDGYELKGLAYPGRDVNFDSNSQVPTGFHNGRVVYYVFGRYPKVPDGNRYPVLDLVICHGTFLNADHDYIHKNKNVKGFGSYGDIMIRDRKMYVVPTPFHLVEGVAHQRTLILPAEVKPGNPFVSVGRLQRVEADELLAGYSFDLQTNELIPRKIPNPGAGKVHEFRAWRVEGKRTEAVKMRQIDLERMELDTDEDDTIA